MSSAAIAFLSELARDRAKLARFRADPEAEIAHVMMTPAEREAVLAGDAARLRAALACHPPSAPSPLAEGRRALEGECASRAFSPHGRSLASDDEWIATRRER